MNTETFVPAKNQKILFAVFYAVFILQLPFSVLFFIEKYPVFVKILLRMRAADMLFSLTGNLIFGLSAFFMWIPLSFFLLRHLFSAFFDMEDTFKYYRKKYIQNYKHMYRPYSFGSLKAAMYFCYGALPVAAVVFCFSIFYHIRVTEDGIYHKKFFAFKTEKCEWADVRRIDFSLKLTDYKGGSVTPHFAVQYAGGAFDLWDGFGMGSPSARELIRFTDLLLIKNKDVRISTVGELSADMLRGLTQYPNAAAEVQKLDAYLKELSAARPAEGEREDFSAAELQVRSFYAALRQLQDEYYADMLNFDFVPSTELKNRFDGIFAENGRYRAIIDKLHSKASQQPDAFLLTLGTAVIGEISAVQKDGGCMLTVHVTAHHRFYYHGDFAAMKASYFRYYKDVCISEDEVCLLQKAAEDTYEKIGQGKFGGITIDTEENHVFRLVNVNGTYKIADFEFNIRAFTPY